MKVEFFKHNVSEKDIARMQNILSNHFLTTGKEIKKYENSLTEIESINLPKLHTNSRSDRHLFTVWTKSTKRDQILEQLQNNRIGVAANYRAIHLLKFYRKTFDYK